MEIRAQKLVESDVSKVWSIIGPGFADAHHWATSITHSELKTGSARCEAAPFSGRICQTSIGAVDENVLSYDAVNHIIEYEAFSSAMPGFVKRLVAKWALFSIDDQRTRVEMNLNVEMSFPFNILMRPMMWIQMRGIMKQTLIDLKYFAETGRAHPSKIKAQRNISQTAS